MIMKPKPLKWMKKYVCVCFGPLGLLLYAGNGGGVCNINRQSKSPSDANRLKSLLINVIGRKIY